MSIPRTLTLLLSIALLTACALVRASEVAVLPTATPTVHAIQTTPVPTIERQTHDVPTTEPEPTSKPGDILCGQAVTQAKTEYTITANMDYKNRSLMVHQQVDYINSTDKGFSQIVLNVRPNIVPGVFKLESAQLEFSKTDLSTAFDGQRMTIDLPTVLASGCKLTFALTFQIHIPGIDQGGEDAYQGYLGYSSRQTNLGLWIPVVAVYDHDSWVSHEEIPIGEQEVLDDANWNVTLDIQGAPDDLLVAAPGEIKANEKGHWQFSLPNARDFSLSMNENATLSAQTTESGVEVDLYTFSDAQIQTEGGTIDTAAFALDSATKALAMYEDLYGQYPYKRLVIVEGDFPDGMEFSGLVFVGGEYFRSFNGPTSYLMIITVHEIAHQWWYARVGNDQALNPWLDEALATYSEYAFIEEYYPALKNWWWNFRVNNLAPEGYVDSTVYDFTTRRAYINAVYLRGVEMLNDLRDNLGTDVFFEWLRRYAQVGTGRVMNPDQFWALLTPEQLQETSAVRSVYLRHPQIAVSTSP